MKGRVRDHIPMGILVCESVGDACRKGWSQRIHDIGRVDSFGYIHISTNRLNRQAQVGNVMKLMVLVGFASNVKFRRADELTGLYLASTWATKEMIRRYRKRPSAYWTAKERRRAQKIRGLRQSNQAMWRWAHGVQVRKWNAEYRRRARLQRSRDNEDGTAVG